MEIPPEIILGCQKNDGECQKKLYELTSPLLYGICLQYTGNEDDAKDILQEGYIKVFRKIDQYKGTGSAMGWIRRIMINTALEKLRKTIPSQDTDNEEKLSSESVSDDIVESLTAEEILKIIQSLSPKYRMVFNLYAIEGYSHKEISELTGISEGTSKSNLSRAREILKRKIQLGFSEAKKQGNE